MQVNYIRGRRARGRRRAVEPRYPPKQWNLYEATLKGEAITNNNQEGWHNRFQTLVGRHHPSFYRFLTELIAEQESTDYNLREIELGHNIRRAPTETTKRQQGRLRNIVDNFENYRVQNNLLGYLRALAAHIVL